MHFLRSPGHSIGYAQSETVNIRNEVRTALGGILRLFGVAGCVVERFGNCVSGQDLEIIGELAIHGDSRATATWF